MQYHWNTQFQNISKNFNRETIICLSPNCLQQKNNYDCGIFLLEYAEKFLSDPHKDFEFTDLQTWFTVEKISSKRSELKLMILKSNITLPQCSEDQRKELNSNLISNFEDLDEREILGFQKDLFLKKRKISIKKSSHFFSFDSKEKKKKVTKQSYKTSGSKSSKKYKCPQCPFLGRDNYQIENHLKGHLGLIVSKYGKVKCRVRLL